ncbi:hypothetical protein Tco_0404912 [Tanacetum coccineum]
MNLVATQQIAHDNALVTHEKRLKIERCNARIEFSKPLKEEKYQVTLDALMLSLCYPAFQITVEVPEIYMHQFWNTIKKIGKTDAYDFKLDKKKCRVDTEVFREILQICPRLPNQDFTELPSEDDLLSFIKELGYSGNCEMLSTIRTDQMHQPWRTFAAIINRCISGKSTRLDRLRESRAQILWPLYKSYLDYATGKVPPKKARKFKKPTSPKLKTVPISPKEPTQKGKRVKRPAKKATTVPTIGVVIRDTPDKSVSKNKAPAKIGRGKGIELLSDAALLEEAQMKKAIKKSQRQTHKLQASGWSKGADFESEVPDEKTDKPKDTNEGTCEKPGVPDVSKDDSTDSEAESCGDSKDEGDDVNDEDDNDDGNGDDDNSDDNDDGGNDDGGNEEDYEENASFPLKDYEEEEQNEEYIFNPKKDKSDDEEKMYEEEDDDVAKELYGDLNITQGLRDTDMTNAEQGTMKSSVVSSDFTSKLLNLDNTGPDVNEIASLMNTSIVPPLPPLINPSSHQIPNFVSLFWFKQRVSALETKLSELNQTNQFTEVVSSIPGIVDQYLASKMKEAVDVAVRLQSNKLKEEAEAENQEFFNQVDSTMKEIIKEHVKAQVSKIMPQIEKYVTTSLVVEVLVRSTNQPQTSYAYNSDKDIITSYGDVVTLKRGRDDQHKDEDPSVGSDRGIKRRKSSKEAEPSKCSKSKESKSSSSSKGTQSQPKSLGKSTQAEEPEFEAANTEMQQDKGNESGHLDDQPDNKAGPKHDWFWSTDNPPTPDRAWNKSKSIDSRLPQNWIHTIAKARQPPRTFDELMDTSIDFSAYVMSHLKIDNLTQEILVGHAFNLLKGLCKRFAELEYHFEECYKAVNDRLNWHNTEGREYPFDLNKPLLLIEDRGRQVVPADYFINNDLEYLNGGSSSSKYMTSTTRTRAAKYENIEGIEDMVPTLWSPVKVAYNKHAVWVMRWYDYGYLEEIVVRIDDNVLYKFKEGDFPRLNMCDIKDMLLLLVHKKLSNLDVDDRYDLGHFSNQRDLPRDIPLDSVVVLRYEKRSKSKNKGKVPTEMELVLEQTQQGTSYEVSVSAEGVKELKRKVKIKGEKKEAILTLRQKQGQYICCQES